MNPLQLTQHPELMAASRKLESALAEYNAVKDRLSRAHGHTELRPRTTTLRFTNNDGVEETATIVLTDC